MSITGTTLRALIPATGATDDALLLGAIQWAVYNAWPSLKLMAREADAGTISASTFEYELTLDPEPHPDIGIAAVYVDREPGAPPVLERRARQRYDQSSGKWTLVFSQAAAGLHDTRRFAVEYQYPHPTPADLSAEMDLPVAYLVPAVTYWLAQRRLSDQPHDARFWRDIMLLNEEQFRAALQRQRTPALTITLERERAR